MRPHPVQLVGYVGVGFSDDDVEVRRSYDRTEIGAYVLAVLGEDLRFPPEHVGRRVEVGVPGVLGGDPECLALTASGDPERDTAILDRQRPPNGSVDLVMLP